MMPVDPKRSFPVNAGHSWHGGVHLTGGSSDPIRCIADGKVVSLRQPNLAKNSIPPLNYNGVTDHGYILLKHETEIGSGDEGKIVYYSLYMHLNKIESSVQPGKIMYRKDPLGTAGMVDDQNACHFQIFCDDDNIEKITGRKTLELDLTKNGRTDIVYGDIHFYVPAGAPVYEIMPDGGTLATNGPVKPTKIDLFVTMSFDKGSCTMVTRQKDSVLGDRYLEVGEPLINADGEDYEYNLYTYAKKFYPYSPSAGYELLRFGRVINTEHEELSPVDASLWRTINTPDGKGAVNLADRNVRVFNDGDFPHWTGWKLVDDDTDTNSQCNSPTIQGLPGGDLNRMICHFPLEWDKSTVDSRFEWLKSPNDVLGEPMAECDLNLLTDHGKALCLEKNPLPSGRVWHFEPRQFIAHFRKCGWLSLSEIIKLVRRYSKSPVSAYDRRHPLSYNELAKRLKEEGTDSTGNIKRPAAIIEALPKILNKYGVNTPIRISHFFGQMAAETGRFDSLVELGSANYFAVHYDPGTDEGRKLGNTNIGDGARFKGRGSIHLTGRTNYGYYSEYRYGSDSNYFTTEPHNELILEDAFFAFDAGGYFWSSKQKYIERNRRLVATGKLGINFWADKGATHDDADEVTGRVNPGRNAFEDVRWPAFKHAWYVLNDSIEQESDYFAIEE
ncbi:peptidase M23 [Salmonella enterica subsp. houtenae serovar 51:z4,z23:-]|nr:peptidase M23 [Salmonella enterica subsp. houtenae serovar 51:z4,z23:-]